MRLPSGGAGVVVCAPCRSLVKGCPVQGTPSRQDVSRKTSLLKLTRTQRPVCPLLMPAGEHRCTKNVPDIAPRWPRQILWQAAVGNHHAARQYRPRPRRCPEHAAPQSRTPDIPAEWLPGRPAARPAEVFGARTEHQATPETPPPHPERSREREGRY